MKKSSSVFLVLFIFALTTLMTLQSAFAAKGRGGGHSLGVGLGIVSSSQKDLNSIIDNVNTSTGAGAKNLNSAYDFTAQYAYRFSGSIFGLVFRPGYFTSSGKGSTSAGTAYNYELTGFSFFPMLRLYPLENSFIRFYMQTGIGLGMLNGAVTQGSNSMKFSGSNFGASAGIGAEFCFTPNHCVAVEGNARYLPIERNTIDSISGTMTGFTQASSKGQEVEYSGNDMSTTMSGIEGIIAYVYNF